MRFVRSISLLLAAAGSASLVACFPFHSVTIGRGPGPGPDGPPVVREGHGHGPPPWAPAHGYRHKHQPAYQSRSATVDLVFDTGLGVYAVVGLPNYYYFNGMYLRLNSGQWWQAQYLDASWAPCADDAVPSGLRGAKENPGHGKSKGKGKSGKGKGHGAAKHQNED